MKQQKKITIGLLVSGITDAYTETVARGVMHAARKANVNLVLMPCKYLDRDLSQQPEIMYEYQYNTILAYARRENLDGLVIMADCIGCHTTKERLNQMLQEYRDIPSVLVASKIEGYVGVSYDNYAGIKEGLEFLINQRGCKKFGMIGGPLDNTDAFERKRTFDEVMEAHRIKIEAHNYAEGNLSRYTTDVFQTFLNNNPDVEAVFCVNDDTAMGLCEEMKKRGLTPGKDIYVLGYDNTELAARMRPSLSTVWADSNSLGVRGLEMVLDMLAGKDVSSEVLATQFIRRETFGTDKAEGYMGDGARYLDMREIEASFYDIFYRCQNEGMEEKAEGIRKAYYALMEKVAQLFEKDGVDAKLQGEVLQSIDRFFASNALDYAHVERMMFYFEKICNMIAAIRMRHGGYEESQAVFANAYRKIVDAMDARFVTMKVEDDAMNYALKLFVNDSMQFKNGNDESYTVLLKRLSWLDIKNAFVYVFEKPIWHLNREKFKLPRHLYLKAALKNGEVHGIAGGGQRKTVSQWYNNSEIGPERYTMVLLPLFSNEMLYGVLLCDMTDRLFENGEFMANQLGAAAKMIDLLKANEQIRQQLEESLMTVRENNIVLDHLSKSDVLTGILNRRGFYNEAEEFLEKSRKAHKNVLVIYVDMNNLKVINDRYGHVEGDYSLQLIGKTLRDLMGPCGIVGRLGGDEFACVIEYHDADEGQALIRELYRRFRAHNEQSDKPYNVTTSAGTYLLKETDRTELSKALSLADERLYLEKQKKDKNVEKR